MFDYEYDNKVKLYFLLVIPAFILLFLLFNSIRRKAMSKYADAEFFSVLMPLRSAFNRNLKFILLISALVFIIMGLAGPKYVKSKETVKEERGRNMEMMIALDISRSMMAEDISPNRLERAKLAIRQVIKTMAEDRIGIIVFAGEAYMQLPITEDYSAAELFLSNISTDMARKQGTAIGSAIELGIKSFSKDEKSSKAIVVISDGENHEDDAIKAASNAAEQGIKIYTIGMGSPEGAPIPIPGTVNKVKDNEGNVVVSKLNSQMLKEIAVAGKGQFFLASERYVGLAQLYENFNRPAEKKKRTVVYKNYTKHFQYYLAIGLFLLLLEMLILEKKSKYHKYFSLFKTR